MTFEQIIEEVGISITNQDRLEKEMDTVWDAPKPMRELSKDLQNELPNGFTAPTESEFESASLGHKDWYNQMSLLIRSHMRDIVNETYAQNMEARAHDRRGLGISKNLQDLVLNPVVNVKDPEDPNAKKTYDQYVNTLQNGTPQEKAQLVMDSVKKLNPQIEKLRGMDLENLDDRQVVDNFRTIFQMKQIVDELDVTYNNDSIGLTETQRESLRQLQQEFKKPLKTAYEHGRVISGPYYSHLDPERFENFNQQEYDDMNPIFLYENPELERYLEHGILPMKKNLAKESTAAVLENVMKEHDPKDVT